MSELNVDACKSALLLYYFLVTSSLPGHTLYMFSRLLYSFYLNVLLEWDYGEGENQSQFFMFHFRTIRGIDYALMPNTIWISDAMYVFELLVFSGATGASAAKAN